MKKGSLGSYEGKGVLTSLLEAKPDMDIAASLTFACGKCSEFASAPNRVTPRAMEEACKLRYWIGSDRLLYGSARRRSGDQRKRSASGGYPATFLTELELPELGRVDIVCADGHRYEPKAVWLRKKMRELLGDMAERRSLDSHPDNKEIKDFGRADLRKQDLRDQRYGRS